MGSPGTEQIDARSEAMGEVLGELVHDLRQPLSNIEAIAYYLSMIVPPGDAKIQAQLASIRDLVEQSNSILTSFLNLPPSVVAAPHPAGSEGA
jgi:signal transduction histidine kinase